MTVLDLGTWVGRAGDWPESLHPTGAAPRSTCPRRSSSATIGLLRDALAPSRRQCRACGRSTRSSATPTGRSCAPSRPQGAGSRSRRSASSRMLQAIGVDPRDVLYSNTVKPAAHVRGAFEAGVWRFAVDSEGELRQDRPLCPGQRGLRPGPGRRLRQRLPALAQVRRRGPPRARAAAAGAAPGPAAVRRHLPRRLAVRGDLGVGAGDRHRSAGSCASCAKDGIVLEMLDIGGGFPAWYGETVPVHRGDRRRRHPFAGRAACPTDRLSWPPSRDVISWPRRP